jgi:hypothetical protein
MFKSIITLFFSIFLNFSLSLASDLKLSMDTELGYVPRAASSEYRTPKEIRYKATDNVFMLTLAPAFEWRFLYGSIDLTAFSAAPKEGVSYVPFRMSYSNEFGLYHQFSSFKASLGWMHNCQHQVITSSPTPRQQKVWNDVGYDKVFLRIHFSN